MSLNRFFGEFWRVPVLCLALVVIGGPAFKAAKAQDDVLSIDESLQRPSEFTVTMPPMDAFWGDRYGKFEDPFGHEWAVMQHIKDMTPEEIGQAAEAYFKNTGDECGN